MKKTILKITAAVMSICLLTACGENNSVSEISVSNTETSAVTVSESSDTAASQTTETSETAETADSTEAAPNSEYMETIKDIFAGRDDTPLYYQVGAADITGDGFPELFVFCTPPGMPPTGKMGYMDIYDIAADGALLWTVNCRDMNGDICTDENGGLHLIVVDDYFFSANTQYKAYFDCSFSDGKSELTVPLLRIVYSWFEDSGEHCFVDRYYKDCIYTGIDNTEFFDLEKNEHNLGGFKFYEDNFIAEYEFEERETKAEVLADENVFGGLEKQYEVSEISSTMSQVSPNEFYEIAEEFLKEIYSN